MSITITITIDDNRDAYEALELVGDCLSKGWQVSTDLTKPTFPDNPTAGQEALVRANEARLRAAFPNVDQTRANAKARIKASQARAAIFNAERDAEHARHVDRDEQRRIHMERHMRAEEARIVACPKCSATEGEFCRRPGGHHGALFVHTARHLATKPVPTTEFIPF